MISFTKYFDGRHTPSLIGHLLNLQIIYCSKCIIFNCGESCAFTRSTNLQVLQVSLNGPIRLQDGRVGSSEMSVIVRLRETVSAKLASFEASNRALRLQLRERQRHDLNAARLVEQRDMLLKVCPPLSPTL